MEAVEDEHQRRIPSLRLVANPVSGKALATLRQLPPRMALPKYTAAWTLKRQIGIQGLSFVEQLPLPPVQEDEVLVKIYAASLNAREVVVAKVNHYIRIPISESWLTVMFRVTL